MSRFVPPALALALISFSPLPSLAQPLKDLKSLPLEVPVSDKLFPGGPVADQINGNCLTCHSEDHVMNQPSLTKEGWEEIVHKMVVAYKAPNSPEDQEAIVTYLARIKGKPE